MLHTICEQKKFIVLVGIITITVYTLNMGRPTILFQNLQEQKFNSIYFSTTT